MQRLTKETLQSVRIGDRVAKADDPNVVDKVWKRDGELVAFNKPLDKLLESGEFNVWRVELK